MATQNLNQIEDYSELGQSFSFKYNEKIYTIPPIPPVIAKKLLRSAREFSSKSADRDAQIKLFEESQKDIAEDLRKPIPAELLEGAEGFFDFQIEFIFISGVKEVEKDSNNLIDINKETVENYWSTQLVMRVFKRINEIISIEQEKKS